MFRRLSHTLPKDPNFPTDLEKLGYFINHNDQIRMIANPDQKYQYIINKNDRFNELYKEAMNTYIRRTVSERLQALELETLRLPIAASEYEPHVPILISKDLTTKKRVLVVFGERLQDLGIFSYRTIGDQGVNIGSAVNFCTAALRSPTVTSDEDAPGIILTNPGQLLWHRGGSRAVTWTEWVNLPRETAVHEHCKIDPIKNTIPGNRDYEQHVAYVFEHVMQNMIAQDVTFDLIGLEYTGRAALMYLANHWDDWSGHVSGICLGNPQHTLQDLIPEASDSKLFADFIAKRCRAYFVFDAQVETLVTGRKEYGCNCYASGERMYSEKIIVQAWRSMLDWFNLVHASSEFEEPEFVTIEKDTYCSG